MRRRIVKRTTISERRVITGDSGSSVSRQLDGETYRIKVVSETTDGECQIYESDLLGEVQINESADGEFSLKGRK